MAAQYIPIKRISTLDTPIKAEKLDGSLFTTENQAHEFIISVRKNGVKQTVTGSVSGKFIRANGTTIFLQGSIVDGDAVVRLHQDCYNVQGRFTFNIFNTQSGVTTCIYSAVGKIDIGSTETVIDAGDVVPDISDVVAKQEEMTQVIADARAATSAASQAATEGENKFVRFDASQTLTEAQKSTARTNIDSPSNAEITDLKRSLSNNPVLGNWYINSLFTSGYYQADGTISTSSNWKHALVDITGINATRLFSYGNRATHNSAFVCFFDSNESLISSFDLFSGLHSYDIPSGASYIGLSAHNTTTNCFFLDTGYITYIQDAVTGIQDAVTGIQDAVTGIQDAVYIDVGELITRHYIQYSSGEAIEISDSDCTDYIAVPTGGVVVHVMNAFAKTNRAGLAEYSANKTFIQCQWYNDNDNTSKEITLNSKTAYVRITSKRGETPLLFMQINNNIQVVNDKIGNVLNDVAQKLIKDGTLLVNGYYKEDGTISPSPNWKCASVDISNRSSDILYNVGSKISNTTAQICFFDTNGTLLKSEHYNVAGTAFDIPQNASHVGLSLRNADEDCNYIIKGELLMLASSSGDNPTLYVSPDGNDANSGLSKSSPLATVNHALELGANTILLASGVYEQQINLELAKSDRILLKRNGQNQDTVTFVDPQRVICTEATLVSGKTKVYSAVSSRTIDTRCIWIYQDGFADRSTLISDAERMPQERGYVYRCEDTKIDLCSSSTLEDALTEIENSDSYLWFYDSNNQTIYFSAPSNDFVTYPICSGRGVGLFSDISTIELEMIGIDVKYMNVNLVGFTGARLSNCKCLNAYSSGAFFYNYGVDITFEHCEAARACNTRSYGDGFNAHGANANLSIPARNCSAKLIDCWSHDNCDDGFSDHERAESLIIGGLFEYNGDGVTPSSGAHCACYGVYSRRNGHGIYYCIASGSSDKGVGGQMYCVDCVSENNTVSGFEVISDGNKMILNNCKSIGNAVGYKCATNTDLEIIDCGSLNDTIAKSISGNLTVKNTTLVE